MNTDKLNLITQVISDLYNLPVTSLNTTEEIELFSKKYFFHSLQDWLMPNSIESFINNLASNSIYHITDKLQIQVIIIKICGQATLLGPFCTLHITKYDCQKLFRTYHLSNLSVTDYMFYRGQFPVISMQNVTHITNTIVKNIEYPDPVTVKEISFFKTDSIIEKQDDMIIEHYYKNIQNHYLLESRLMNNIKNGNTHAAILNLRNLQQDVAQFKQIGTVIENERMGAAITRTLVRIAASEAGLPAYRIHELSSENSKSIKNATSIDEIYELKEKMIITFCREINAARNRRYSNIVLSSIYYMQRKISQDISINELAQELDVSPNYLSTIFKKETGNTPSEYLRKARMKQAASLLSGSDLSIQDISNLVGITDSNYFVKLFKKEYNYTPSQYRKVHNN